MSTQFVHVAVEQLDTLVEGTQEAVLFLFHHAADEFLLGGQLGISLAHLLHEYGHELVEECTLLAEEGIGVADSTAQNATDDISGLGVAGQLAVSDGEGHGTQVVGNHTHGDVDLLLLVGTLTILASRCGEAIFLSGEILNLLDNGLEDIRVVVRVLSLQHAHETLKAHTRINDVHRQWFQAAVGLAVELHEDDVPDLDDLRVVFVDELASGHFGFLAVGAGVYVDLRAGAARAGLTHLPEVVVLIAVDDMVGRYVLAPVLSSLVVTLQSFRGIALEDGDIEIGGIEVQHVHEIFPGIVDGTLFEVVTEAPVAEHLEHRVVVSIVSHLFQIVVLTADAQTLLRVAATTWIRVLGAKDDVFPLVHTCIRKHQRRVVLDNHRGRRNDDVSFRLKELLKRVADFICCHHDDICFICFLYSFDIQVQRY